LFPQGRGGKKEERKVLPVVNRDGRTAKKGGGKTRPVFSYQVKNGTTPNRKEKNERIFRLGGGFVKFSMKFT